LEEVLWQNNIIIKKREDQLKDIEVHPDLHDMHNELPRSKLTGYPS